MTTLRPATQQPPPNVVCELVRVAKTASIAFVAAGALLVEDPTAQQPQAAASAGFALVWSDEFSVDGPPDPKNWTYERGFVRNEELQWYQPENARVTDGQLVIEARRERAPNPNYQPGSTDWKRNREFSGYTSASLITRGLHSWQYGRFEMRARIDTRAGLWPAFWTLGIVRRLAAQRRSGHHGVLPRHAPRECRVGRRAGAAQPGTAPASPSRRSMPRGRAGSTSGAWIGTRMPIRLFVDDELLNETDLATTINPDGTNVNPLRQPHYIIVNLAIGGTAGGDPSATEFPARLEVDYIRVYQ